MCVIFFAYKQHPRYELIVASNRDESYDRPSLPAHFWEDRPRLLAGRDVVQGGTWLGVTQNGRFAALTNHRQGMAEEPAKRSRGELVVNFLMSNDRPDVYVAKTRVQKDEYNGFHLLVYDRRELYYYSAPDDRKERLAPGVYGLSNASLGASWPKTIKGRRRLKEILEEDASRVSFQKLFELLADRERADDAELPDTGVGLEYERLLSSLFIHSENYGTRASTVLTIDRDGQAEFLERTFRDGQPAGDAHFRFQIESLA